MIYLLNQHLDDKSVNDAITNQEIEQMQQWTKHRQQIKFLTMNYDPLERLNLTFLHLEHQVVNMFDLWQQASPALPLWNGYPTAFDLGWNKDLVISPNHPLAHVMLSDDEVATIHLFNGTEQVMQVDYLDKLQNLLRTDLYDSRGFLSRSLYYGNDERLVHAITYNLMHEVIMTEDFSHATAQNVLSRLVLHYQGTLHRFNDYDTLFLYFLTQFIHDDDILIAEQPLMMQMLAQLDPNIHCMRYLLINPQSTSTHWQSILQQDASVFDGLLVYQDSQRQTINQWLVAHQIHNLNCHLMS